MGILLEIGNRYGKKHRMNTPINIKGNMDKLSDFEMIKHARNDRYTEGRIAIKDGIAIGYVIIDIRTKYIVSLEVHPKYKKQKNLSQYLVDIGKQLGAEYIAVGINNTEDKDIHLSNGCTVIKKDDYMFYIKI